MKKYLTCVSVLVAFAALVSACNVTSDPSGNQTETTTQTETELINVKDLKYYEETTLGEQMHIVYGEGNEIIQLWSFDDEVPNMVRLYVREHPEFAKKYQVEVKLIDNDSGLYYTALSNSLVAGGDLTADIYVVDEAHLAEYTQGFMGKFASTYKDLGIDVDTGIKEADIAPYIVEAGMRNGEVAALSYMSTGCVMIYNSDIAKAVFGTDEPAEIEKIVGAGSGDWDKFMKAAAKIKEKGYVAVSGPSDLWNSCDKSADTPWIVDGEVKIDPEREKYLDLAKTITDKGYSNNTRLWTQEWRADMYGGGSKKVFAFFAPSWFINELMSERPGNLYGKWRVCVPPVCSYWNGMWLLGNKDSKHKEGVAELLEWITLDTSETGLQYLYANGLIDWDYDPTTVSYKGAVASSVVMAKSNGSNDFCGGQDIYPAIIASSKKASAKAISEYDEDCSYSFMNASLQYSFGRIKRNEAIEGFKKEIKEYFSL